MKTLLAGIAVLFIFSACGINPDAAIEDAINVSGKKLPPRNGPNVLPLTVNGSKCAPNSYPNKPCVEVTICAPGTSLCQTVSDILVDTGSFGFRVFRSALDPRVSSALTPVRVQGKALAECAHFGDGSKDWGPIQKASIRLGDEPEILIPVHVMDSTFSDPSLFCDNADTSPAQAGMNGILGIGLFAQDCGDTCVGADDNGVYFACDNTTCTGTRVELSKQVPNPVAQLPIDNNGVLVELPEAPLGGTRGLNGYLVLGIGTRGNNVPPIGVRFFQADESTAEIKTAVNGKKINAFLDSGSNGFFFTAALPNCSTVDAKYSGWFCPKETVDLSATLIGDTGTSHDIVQFHVGNVVRLAGSGNSVFTELAGISGRPTAFNWGLPFHIGRSVYNSVAGKSSPLGQGLYWAY